MKSFLLQQLKLSSSQDRG